MLLQKLIQPTLRGNSSFCSQVQWMVIWAVIWWHFDSCLQLARTFSPIMFSELWAIELFFLLLRTPVHSSYCNALWLNFSFFKGQLFSEHIFPGNSCSKSQWKFVQPRDGSTGIDCKCARAVLSQVSWAKKCQMFLK